MFCLETEVSVVLIGVSIFTKEGEKSQSILRFGEPEVKKNLLGLSDVSRQYIHDDGNLFNSLTKEDLFKPIKVKARFDKGYDGKYSLKISEFVDTQGKKHCFEI